MRAHSKRGNEAATTFYTVIKLGARKFFTRSTTAPALTKIFGDMNTDARPSSISVPNLKWIGQFVQKL